MYKNIKILFKNDGKLGQECVLVVDNKPVTYENMFDNYLGECDMSLDDYKALTIEEKIKEHIAGVADGYYNSDDLMNEHFKQSNLLNVAEYELIDEKDIDITELVKMVDCFAKNKKDSFTKYKDIVIKKLDFK